jgi:hypothetical protein
MFDGLEGSALDLTVTTKGLGYALPASTESQGGGDKSSSSCSLSSSLCCSFHLCV